MDLLKQYLDISVLTILGLMSFIALARVIERWLHYRRIDITDYPQLESLKLDLNHGLSIIATIASNAPYVGLLGTVFGIMLTFHDIGQSGLIDTATIMIGLSLALKATALGLLVAIPSMVAYNGLVAKAETLLSRWKIANHWNAGNPRDPSFLEAGADSSSSTDPRAGNTRTIDSQAS